MSHKAGKKQLNDKQELFCREYLVDLNATQAAIRAGYSKKTAGKNIKQLMENKGIASRIKELQAPRLKRLDISAERVLQEVARLSYVDIRKAFDENGNLKNVHDIDDDTAAALSSVETDELFAGSGKDRERIGETRKVRFHDKKGSLELLMKHLKLINSGPDVPDGTRRIIFEMACEKPKK